MNAKRIETTGPESLGHHESLTIAPFVQVRGHYAAEHGATAEERRSPTGALLFKEGDDFEGVLEISAVLEECLRYLDPTQDADCAIVSTPVDHRIDVRSNGQSAQIAVLAVPASDQIAGRIHSGYEAGFLHPRGD